LSKFVEKAAFFHEPEFSLADSPGLRTSTHCRMSSVAIGQTWEAT
jgi:hypothetical protein